MNYTVGETEYNMEDVTYPFSNVLKSSLSPGAFNFSLRIWMPKAMAHLTAKKDFKILICISEST
jgi:hypothetical protein